ncbi:MAG: hypothetical protein ABI954_15615 [Pyrinomonadaceae bacterium]
MPEQEPNYVKEVVSSQWNLAFIGVMFLLMVMINFIGFGALLVAGEVAAVLLAQHPLVQRWIKFRSQIEGQENLVKKEKELVAGLPPNYQQDFAGVEQLCREIQQKWQSDANLASNNYLLKDLIDKLGSFRYEYARMLQAYYTTANRDISGLTTRLQRELQTNEASLESEKSPKVRDVLAQNVRIIKQRLQRTLQLSDLLRLLSARLAVVKNSLSLLQDEIFTVSDPENVSSAVDNLLLTLNIDDELKATYEDVLSSKTEAPAPLAAAPPTPQNLQQKRQTNLRRIK